MKVLGDLQLSRLPVNYVRHICVFLFFTFNSSLIPDHRMFNPLKSIISRLSNPNESHNNDDNSQHYNAKGVIYDFNLKENKILINHDKIEGFMENFKPYRITTFNKHPFKSFSTVLMLLSCYFGMEISIFLTKIIFGYYFGSI